MSLQRSAGVFLVLLVVVCRALLGATEVSLGLEGSARVCRGLSRCAGVC